MEEYYYFFLFKKSGSDIKLMNKIKQLWRVLSNAVYNILRQLRTFSRWAIE